MDVRLIRAAHFVRTTVSGDFDFAASRRVLRRLLAQRGQAEVDLLVDLRGTRGLLTYADVHRLVDEMRVHAPQFRRKVALLARWETGFEQAQFFEYDAQRHGFLVRAFPDFEQAVTWLHEDDGPAR